MRIDVITLANENAGRIDLDESVFGLPVRKDLLHRMVNWQLAKRRAGTHKVKSVSEVSGTGKKPFRQKGSGRHRQGQARAVGMRAGGVAFGPTPRNHGHALPKKVRRLALKTALSSKAADGKLIVLDSAKLEDPKTKALAEKLNILGWSNALIVDGAELDGNFKRAAANIPLLDLLPQQGANVFDILRRDTLVLTKGAVEALEARLK